MQKVIVYDATAHDKLGAVRGAGRYLQILKENFPDWIFTNNLSSRINNQESIFINPFFNFFQPPVIDKRIAVKQIAVIHDLIPIKHPSHFPAGLRGNINIYRNRLALKNYDLFVADSQASKKDIVEILNIPEEKIKVIYPCLPKSFTDSGVARKLAPQNDVILASGRSPQVQNLPQKFCLYVGDATWNKNLVNLVRAIKIINVTCVFVGKVFESTSRVINAKDLSNPWQRELKQFLIDTKDDKRFIFTGFISDSELIKFYQQARLNVLPSRDEGFGFSFVEAAQFSCPSVLADIPVLRETSEGASLFADPENPNDLADKIGEIYFNNEIRSAIGTRAKKRSEFFNPEKFRKDFLSII